jgi:MFS family permease
MIVTHKSRVPWIWVLIMTLPWGVGSLMGGVNGQAITYTIKKYIDDPSWIALLTSINLMSNVLVGAPCNYMSDRIWTRWGRRRPFLITSCLSTAILLLLMPFIPNLWMLIVINLALQVAIDANTPAEALYFEVIPQPQRGRAVAIRNFTMGLAGMLFGLVLFAHFDDRYSFDLSRFGLGTVDWNGERTLYFSAALALLLVNGGIYIFRVRETPVESPLRGQRFSLRGFVKDVFGDRRWHLVYLYYAVPAVIGAGVGQFAPLVMTDVFGYTKADMVHIGVPTTLVALFVYTPLFGSLADRVPRVRMFQFGVMGVVAHVAWTWIYIKMLAPAGFPHASFSMPWFGGPLTCDLAPVNGVPSLGFLFVNGLLGSVFGTAIGVTYGALLFDLIPSNRMGTLASGFGLINSVIGVVFMNLCGLFVKYYSKLFYAPHRQDPGKYDYTSIYLFQAVLGLLGVAMYLYFLRQFKRGRVPEYGKLEVQEEQREEAEHATGPAKLPA